jgi:Flp pilus assembly protein TadD
VTRGKAYGLVLSVALLTSAGSLANGFVYDDVPVIVQDARIHSLARLPSLVTAPYWPRTYENNAYRPSTTVAFALAWKAGDGHPLAFHVADVLLNLAVVALVLALALRVLPPGAAVAEAPGPDRAGGAKEASAVKASAAGAVVGALWFAVQPVHVEAVANGVGLAELLAAAAYLGALLAYVTDGDVAATSPPGGAQARRGWLAAAVLGGAAIAYGAKEHALTLPAVLLLADFWQAGGNPRRAWDGFRRHAILWLGTVVVALGYLAARAHVLGAGFSGGAVAPGLEGLTPLGRALVMAPAVLVWLRWLILPLHFSADYLPDAFVPVARLGPAQMAGFAAIAALAYAAWAARRRLPAVTLGLVFTAITASVAANVVVPTGVVLAERLAYLPTAGIAIVAGALWARLPRGRALWPATALVLALLAARSIQRATVWHDSSSFLSALRRDAPDSYRTHWALGQEAFRRGRRGEGEREMLAAIRLYPGDPQVLEELGNQYLDAGVFDPAARLLLAAYGVDSLRRGAVVRAVFALLKAGHPDSAADVGTAALRRFPRAAALLLATASAELASGRPHQALALARRLVVATPGSWGSEQLAGVAAAGAGRCEEARARLSRAAALAPVSQTSPQDLLRRLGRGPRCGLPPPAPGSAR